MKNLIFLFKNLNEREIYSLILHTVIYVAFVSLVIWAYSKLDDPPFLVELLIGIFFVVLAVILFSFLDKKNRTFLNKGEETEEDRKKRLGQYPKLPLNLK